VERQLVLYSQPLQPQGLSPAQFPYLSFPLDVFFFFHQQVIIQGCGRGRRLVSKGKRRKKDRKCAGGQWRSFMFVSRLEWQREKTKDANTGQPLRPPALLCGKDMTSAVTNNGEEDRKLPTDQAQRSVESRGLTWLSVTFPSPLVTARVMFFTERWGAGAISLVAIFFRKHFLILSWCLP